MPGQRLCPKCEKLFTNDEKFCDIDHEQLIYRSFSNSIDIHDVLFNKRLDGKYIIKQKLGEGGMGVVYEGLQLSLNRRVAVKVLLQQPGYSDGMDAQRFRREAQAAARLSAHPNIVMVHDFGQESVAREVPVEIRGRLYLVMEFLTGNTVWSLLTKGPLSPSRAVSIALQIAEALHFAHQKKVIHRDIKSPNIFISTQDNSLDCVKVLDFGIARLLDEKAITADPSQVIGTADYLAPEAWKRPNQPMPAIDLYALGILIFEMLLGYTPFANPAAAGTTGLEAQVYKLMQAHLNEQPPSISSKRKEGPRLPMELDRLVTALLDKDPAKRPTAAETVVQLKRILKELSPRAGTSTQLNRLTQKHAPASNLQEAAIHLLAATGADSLEDQATKVLSRLPTHALEATTRPRSSDANLEFRRASERLEVLEEQLDEASKAAVQLAAQLRAVQLAKSPPEEIVRLAGRVSYLEDECAAQQKLHERCEDGLEEERQRLLFERDKLQEQIIDVLTSLRATPSLDQATRYTLEQKHIALEWERDAIKTTPAILDKQIAVEQSLQGLMHALYYARWQLADATARALAGRRGFLRLLHRSEPAQKELQSLLDHTAELLSEVRKLHELFPALRPQNTIPVPPSATIQFKTARRDA